LAQNDVVIVAQIYYQAVLSPHVVAVPGAPA
jgi:hypothetical protein